MQARAQKSVQRDCGAEAPNRLELHVSTVSPHTEGKPINITRALIVSRRELGATVVTGQLSRTVTREAEDPATKVAKPRTNSVNKQ